MPRRTAFDWVLEVFALAAVIATFTFVAAHWEQLPVKIPTHFGAAGRPNAWGSKSSVWLLPIISAGCYLLLLIASRHQGLVNLPVSVDRERPEVRQLLFRFVNVLKAVVTAMFFYLSWSSVNTALGRANGLGRAFLPIVLAATLLPVGFYLIKLKSYRA